MGSYQWTLLSLCGFGKFFSFKRLGSCSFFLQVGWQTMFAVILA